MTILYIMKGVSARLCSLWLAFVFAFVLLLSSPALPITTALQASKGSFLQAFTDPRVTEILVTLDNYQLSKEAWNEFTAEKPYVLDRDMLVRSTTKPFGQLDFQFITNKVLIKSNVTITFKQLALRNVKKLSGFGLDFFMGESNSTIVLDDVARVKLVCNPIQDALTSTSSYVSIPPWPPNKVSVRDDLCIGSPTGENVCYQNGLYFENFTFVVAKSDPESGYNYGGYVLHMTNTTRVCDHYVTEQCIQQAGLDTCMAQLLDEVINGTNTNKGLTTGAIAGIAVAGAVVLAIVAGCCYFRVRIMQCLVRMGGESLKELDSISSGDTPSTTLLPSGPGGAITSVKTSARESVRLGVLLGSGSFGRVYKGRWHGTDVAVKIIACSPAELNKVLKEAEVMMQLAHPNIVRAFQCSVFKPLQQHKPAQGRQAPASNSSRPSSSAAQLSSSTQSGSRPPAQDSVVVSIMPEIVQQPQRSQPAGVPSNSSTGSGRPSIGSHLASGSAAGHGSGDRGSAAAAGSGSSGAARRFLSKVLHPVQQHQQQQQQQRALQGSSGAGPSTRSLSSEGHYRRVVTPVSSATPTAAGSSGAYQGPLVMPGSSELGSSTMPASGVSSQDAPLMIIPTTASGSMWPHASGAAAATSATHNSSAENLLPSGVMADVSSPTVGSRGSSRMYSSGPQALGEGRDGTTWSAVLVGQRPRSSGNSRAATNSSGDLDPMPLWQGSFVNPGSNPSGEVGEVQPAVRWFRRGKRGSSGSTSGGAAAGQHSSSGKQRDHAVRVPGQALDSSEDEQRQDVQVWLVLELCNGGTLKDAVSMGKLRTGNRLELAKLLSRLLDAANGMAYLHSRGILHGDLKAGNVLLFNSIHGAYGQISKISDFGLAATLMDGATHRSTASMGTITHMAPEVLRSGHMSAAGDVYSFGIMMWELFTNQSAHAGLHYGAVVERVVVRGERPPVPSNMPTEYSMLMQNCWDADAAKRPTFAQLIQCIELLLDNLTSDSEGTISEGSEHSISTSGQQDGAAAGPSAAAADVELALTAAKGGRRKLQGFGTSSFSVSETGSGGRAPSGQGSGPASSAAPSGATATGAVQSTPSSSAVQAESTSGQQLSSQQLQDLQRWQAQQQQLLQQVTAPSEPLLQTYGGLGVSSDGNAGKVSAAGSSGSLDAGAGSSAQLPPTPTPQPLTAITQGQAPWVQAVKPPGRPGGRDASAFVQDL